MNKKLYSFWICIFAATMLTWRYDQSTNADETRQVIVHFTHVPNDEHHHKDLAEVIEESVDLINAKLVRDGLIAPLLIKPEDNASFKDKISYYFKNSYYRLFYTMHASKYPNKPNRAFFTRRNKALGIYSMYIPDGVTTDSFIKYLHAIYKQKGVEFHIDPDASIRVTQNPNRGLEGIYFTAEELTKVQQGQLPDRTKKLLTKRQLPESRITDAFLWHLSFPTVGVLLKEPFYPPPYPFLPHYFSLWQLAPKKGDGIRVAVIDTGIAAYHVQNNSAYLKNESIQPKIIPGQHNFNIVSSYGLDPLEQYIHTIKQYIDPEKFNEEYLETSLPAWIKEYLIQNSDAPLANYLRENGKSQYVSDKELTDAGKSVLQELLTGDQGIEPTNPAINQLFTVAKMVKPIEQDVILEFLPAPEITAQPVTFVAGHGTHTFGLVSAQNIGNGITGIAPQAITFMIKGFKDDGTSDQSTLLTALKKAIVHDAQIVNLSLKVANELDMTDQTAQLFERVINLIPYVVAASGNDGDPSRSGLTKPVESYPARFASVPFDVGAFAYEDKKATIPAFSQYEPDIGPLFVAPGFDILSTAIIPGQTVSSIYMFLAGTSMAAPLMSGFIALMLAEFQDIFTREQLLKVCYVSTIRLQDSSDWKLKTLLGTLDMRLALFTLHALAAIKKELKTEINFDESFDAVLQAVHYTLFADVDEYSKKYLSNVSFKDNYLAYLNSAIEHKDKLSVEKFLVPASMEEAIKNVVDRIKAALKDNNFEKKSVNLFGDLASPVQKRIAAKEKIDSYWITQAEQLKKRLAQEEDIIDSQ